MAGDGTMFGLISNNAKVPTIPITAEKMNPDLDLSIKYHSTGFTRARVKETCNVDCQGNRLCINWSELHNAQISENLQ